MEKMQVVELRCTAKSSALIHLRNQKHANDYQILFALIQIILKDTREELSLQIQLDLENLISRTNNLGLPQSLPLALLVLCLRIGHYKFESTPLYTTYENTPLRLKKDGHIDRVAYSLYLNKKKANLAQYYLVVLIMQNILVS